MENRYTTYRLLGAAFLIQALASAIGGFILLDPILSAGDVPAILARIADNPLQLQASILVELITSMGIVMLGIMMYQVLKAQNQDLAKVAMGLYIFEAAILAISRIPLGMLLTVSQEALQLGFVDHLQTLARIYIDTASFGYELHMLPFAVGATIFYTLFFLSNITPKWLSTVGIIAAPLALIGTVFVLLGIDIPIIIFIPNLPFELAMGVWFLFFGSRKTSE